MSGGQLVPGDAHPTAESLVPSLHDRLERMRLGVELRPTVDRMQLVEIELVAAEQLQRLLQLGPNPVATVSERLAGNEEPITYCGDQRPEQLLRSSVLRCHVEVVDTGVQRLGKDGLGDVGISVPKGRPAEDGHRRVVPGPSQPSCLHTCTVAPSCGGGDRPRPDRTQPDDAALRAASHSPTMAPKRIGL